MKEKTQQPYYFDMEQNAIYETATGKVISKDLCCYLLNNQAKTINDLNAEIDIRRSFYKNLSAENDKLLYDYNMAQIELDKNKSKIGALRAVDIYLEKHKFNLRLKGTFYFKKAVWMMTESAIPLQVCNDIYSDIANRYNTTMSKVERSMRYAIASSDLKSLTNGKAIKKAVFDIFKKV